MKSKVFHSFVALYYCAVGFGGFNIVVPQQVKKLTEDLNYRYMTNWNLAIQIIFCLLCLTYDFHKIFYIEKWSNQLKKFLDFIFYSIVGPNNLFVSIAFWSIYAYDSLAIFPIPLNTILPDWLNHFIHTGIVLLSFLDIVFTDRKTPSFKISFVIYTSFVTYFGLSMVHLYVTRGLWVYPIFYELTNFQRVMLMCFFVTAGMVSYLTIWYTKIFLDKAVNRLEPAKLHKSN